MPSTTTYEPGQVLTVDYRHTDGSSGGKRPVVVLSTKKHNSRDVVVAQISTQLHQLRLPGSVELKDWQQAGLFDRSLVKPVFASYQLADVRKILGSLSNRDWRAVKLSVAEVLGFAIVKRKPS